MFNFTNASSTTIISDCVFSISVWTSRLPVTVRLVNVGELEVVQALPQEVMELISLRVRELLLSVLTYLKSLLI